MLAIFNGHKHLPHRESPVTGVLRECLAGVTCHATMIAHVSSLPQHYSQTLHTVQLASRVHRMRRKRNKKTSSGSSGSTSSDEKRRVSDLTTSTDPSSSEMSCDTVLYRPNSDGSGTDGEAPPLTIRSLRSSQESLLSRSSRRRSGSRILTNGAISPRNTSSPMLSLPMIDERMERMEGMERMPLNGPVPGFRQREVWIDSPINNNNNRNYKTEMISHWVENQSFKTPEHNSQQCLFLTQFKQADSDNASDVVVKITDKKVAPPPPPRKTPPKQREEVIEGSESPEPLIDPGLSPFKSRSDSKDVSEIETLEEEQRRRSGLTLVDGGCKTLEDSNHQELLSSTDPNHQHPLRILSEENLTVVSTFVADINDLEDADDIEDEMDPSKFSFFSVPDFTTINNNNDIESRLKELANIEDDHENANNPVTNAEQCSDDKNKVDNNKDESFTDPRFLFGNYREMSSFSSNQDPMTPQKQFLLLSQSLRHPDGSSDPDLTSKRSPGNGQSSSDQEDEDVIENIINDNVREEKPKKTEWTFAARLLRLFSSKRSKSKTQTAAKRSKSCDRELESSEMLNQSGVRSVKDVRSASSSPQKQREKKKKTKNNIEEADCVTPVSCLSLAPTEWEYQMQDEENANNRDINQRHHHQVRERKSSGYDSFESLDSSSDLMDQLKFNTVKYAVPTDNTTNNYDEVAILKREIKRHPNILKNLL